MEISTHLILVSSQPIPNLTPVLDERYKPNKTVMLVSPDMQQRADALESIYKPRGIKVEQCRIDDPWDADKISDSILDLLDAYPEGSIALNATGGTKLMSISAFEVFRSCNQPIFYIHPERDRLIWLNPKQPSIDLANRIKIKDYLIAYGASDVNIPSPFGVPESIRQLGEDIIGKIQSHGEALGILNYLAYKADKPNLTVEIDHGPKAKPDLWELLDHFVEAGLCTINGHELRFKSKEARFLANGGWLEQYTYGLCLNLKKNLNFQDIATNIEIKRQPTGGAVVKNEIDIGFIANNRLHLIECKTKQYQKSDDKNADVLYKLDSLRDLVGGLQGRALLVSFNKPDAQSEARAKELDIQLCCGVDLQDLQHHIQKWATLRS